MVRQYQQDKQLIYHFLFEFKQNSSLKKTARSDNLFFQIQVY
jgi:hypothetical protein